MGSALEPAHDQRSRQDEAGADLKKGNGPAVRGLGRGGKKRLRGKLKPGSPELIFSSCSVLSAPLFHFRRVFMSQHRSLKGASTITTKRNVLKRFERVELLKKRGLFKPGDKVVGLPKTKPEA
jgi:small basic protein (TIGR04137 family)